ncbi:MAG: hypothetical protein KF833_13495 [Verrucomicrobiae bacterium]|nr:hypothetical protein [Verrucomicrobiae bacterium]
MKNLALILVFAALSLGATTVSAKEMPAPRVTVDALNGVSAAELPATAVKIVSTAPQQSRAAVVGIVMRKVARTHPAAIHHVVAAIAKAEPSLATTAAAAAARANPENVSLIAASACSAAPERAAEILAVCSRLTTTSSSSLAQEVAFAHPSVFSATTLAQDAAALEITSDAVVARGGTVISGLIPPGSIGQTIAGSKVTLPPKAVGPGRPGFDPDRYGAAGN